MARKTDSLLAQVRTIYEAAAASDDGERCMVAASPDLHKKIGKELKAAGKALKSLPIGEVHAHRPQKFGLNDGLIIPGSEFPLGTPPATIKSAAAERAPLRGVVRVVVVLVEFSDRKMKASKEHFEELFFSQGTMETGSVRDFYQEVTNGLIDIQGQVAGPFKLPQTLAEYANGASGMGEEAPNARTMARDAVEAADPSINFGPYDNDGNGVVDAFIVVHAGSGAEETGKAGDIWSHKWLIEGNPYATDGTRVYGYLTIPEDGKVGVCAHELGHLLFGWPDLYDTDSSSSGIGSWCLMAAGSWNGGGDRPAHPSAWCKVQQGWVTVANQLDNEVVSIPDVKDGQTVYRLWHEGEPSQEFYLVENRQKVKFDDHLEESGILLWHIDGAVETNKDENHPKVALMQADGKRDLERRVNRGDPGDPYPGSSGSRTFDDGSTPSSRSYAGSPTSVSVTEISDPGPMMSARLSVRASMAPIGAAKQMAPEAGPKALIKDSVDTKAVRDKHFDKQFIQEKPRFEKQLHDKVKRDIFVQKPWTWPREPPPPPLVGGDLEARLAAVEAQLGQAQPFISDELRPDLSGGAFEAEEGVSQKAQERLENPLEKRLLDVPPAFS